MIPAFLLGAFAWTLAEYLLHDFVGHRTRGRTEFSREHLRHHREEGYFAPTPQKIRFALVLLVPMGLVGGFVAGPAGLAFTVGFALAWTVYEVLHRRIHTAAPLNRYGLWARRHHLAHHHRDATRNHGVSSPLWDVVFRTWQPTSPVRIPRKRAPDWLVAPEGGVRPEYAADFVLVGPPRRDVPTQPEASVHGALDAGVGA